MGFMDLELDLAAKGFCGEGALLHDWEAIKTHTLLVMEEGEG